MFVKTAQGSTQRPADLVRSARELAAVGVSDNFVNDWSFLKPRQGIKKAMLSLAMEYGNDQAIETAKTAQNMSHEQAQGKLLELLDNLDTSSESLIQLHGKLASLPELEEFDTRICGVDYPDATIRPKLASIGIIVGQPLVGKFLSTPISGYRNQIEQAPREIQRRVQICLG
jgi:hypothetical protein